MMGGMCALSPLLYAADATVDDLRKTVETQQQAIDRLQKQVDATAAALDSGNHGNAAGAGGTHIGGYGELHYTNLDSGTQLDYPRFVLEFSHRFSDSIRLHAELELEHSVASHDDVGDVELDQAYVDFDLNERHTARAGLFLVPVGIINETHEPPTFYGVERNPVETFIIPTTWWEGGGGLNGELAPGIRYDLAITSGFNVATSGPDAYLIRGGRQEVAEAKADNLAYTARLRWTGMAGVELAGTVQFQDDVTEGAVHVSATVVLANAVIWKCPLGLRAVYY